MRRIGGLSALGVGLALVVPAWQPAATASSPTTPRSAAATWLANVAPDGILTTNGSPDWGLTAANVFAQAAGGRGATTGAAATDALAAHVGAFASDPTGTARNAGALSKLLLVAAVQGRDATSFGGWNLRAELLARMESSGAQTGRFRNSGLGDTTNGFSQALGIIGLQRTGGAPAASLTFLRAQQCPGGAFRLFYLGDTCTAAASADADATAVAVEALLAGGESADSAAAAAALDWLESVQLADGSFRAAGPGGVANANTTGLAAQALRAGGRTAAADRAAGWLMDLQLVCADEVSTASLGAIAYDVASHDDAVGAGTVDETNADLFVRATTDAALGLGAPSLAVLSASGNTDDPPTGGCIVPPTTPPAPGASSTTAPVGSTTPPPSSTAPLVSTSTTTTTTSTSTTSTTSLPTTSSTAVRAVASTQASSADRSSSGVLVEGTSITARANSRSATGSSGLAATGSPASRSAMAGGLLVIAGLALLGSRRLRAALDRVPRWR